VAEAAVTAGGHSRSAMGSTPLAGMVQWREQLPLSVVKVSDRPERLAIHDRILHIVVHAVDLSHSQPQSA